MNFMDSIKDLEKYYKGWIQFLFSEAICEYLENNNISRERFAKDLNLTIEYINQILDDVERTTLEDMAKIVTYFESKNIHINIKFEEYKPI